MWLPSSLAPLRAGARPSGTPEAETAVPTTCCPAGQRESRAQTPRALPSRVNSLSQVGACSSEDPPRSGHGCACPSFCLHASAPPASLPSNPATPPAPGRSHSPRWPLAPFHAPPPLRTLRGPHGLGSQPKPCARHARPCQAGVKLAAHPFPPPCLCTRCSPARAPFPLPLSLPLGVSTCPRLTALQCHPRKLFQNPDSVHPPLQVGHDL